MADLNHWWGGDLSLSPSGDLSTVNNLDRDNQRIFRRVCTNGGRSGGEVAEYLFHPDYGGSAPWYVGRTPDPLTLEGVIRSQMYQEASVSHDPEPVLTPNVNPNGTFLVRIQYTNNNTGEQAPPLVLDVTG